MESAVTVLVRTYNSQETIERALNSVIEQTLHCDLFSILVVDDGSTDDSIRRVQQYMDVTFLRTDHKGSIAALNTGLKAVETPYVILLDSDDWFEPTILEKMYSVFEQNPITGFVYSDYYEVVDGSKKLVSVRDNIFNTVAAGIMFSLDVLQSHGYYDESLVFPEYDLLIQMLSSTTHFHIPEPLYNYVRHEGSITADKSLVELGRRQLFEKYGRRYPIRNY